MYNPKSMTIYEKTHKKDRAHSPVSSVSITSQACKKSFSTKKSDQLHAEIAKDRYAYMFSRTSPLYAADTGNGTNRYISAAQGTQHMS